MLYARSKHVSETSTAALRAVVDKCRRWLGDMAGLAARRLPRHGHGHGPRPKMAPLPLPSARDLVGVVHALLLELQAAYASWHTLDDAQAQAQALDAQHHEVWTTLSSWHTELLGILLEPDPGRAAAARVRECLCTPRGAAPYAS